MRRWFYNGTIGGLGSTGLLVLRLVVGFAFVLHGWPKIQHPLNWMGDNPGVPAIMQALAAIGEFGGGILLMAGLLTRFACLYVGGVMAVALGMVHLPMGHPFVGQPTQPLGDTAELATVYLASAIALLLLGPGRYSLDALLFRGKPASTT